jgi:hypothetical protein
MRKPLAEQKVGREGRGRVKFVRGEAALYPYHIPSDSFLASPSCASGRSAGNVFRQIKYVQFAIDPPPHTQIISCYALFQADLAATGCRVQRRPSRLSSTWGP